MLSQSFLKGSEGRSRKWSLPPNIRIQSRSNDGEV